MPLFKRMTEHALPSTTADFEPVRVLEVELSQQLPAVSAVDGETGRHYCRARALVRLHTQPLGLVDLPLGDKGLSADEYACRIWAALGQQINTHLRWDALPEVAGLDAAGLPHTAPLCLQERARTLADAPFATVVVATRDRADILAKSLRSLLALDYPRYEILVVDNAPSTNATAELVHGTYGHLSHVRYVREDRVGVVWARNRGLIEARGETVAYADDDVIVDQYWLAELVKGFQVADNVACVTGLILPLELETPAQVWFEQFGGFSKGFTRRIFDLAEHRPALALYPYAPGTFGSGNSMAFRVSVFRSLGGFDPNLCVAGAEDPAAFFDIIINGYTLVYEPAAIACHLHRREYTGLQKQMLWYGIGLTAYLTKCIVDNPWLLVDFARKIPYGLFYMFGSRSPKNRKKASEYPKELTHLERKGAFFGPLAYLRGRWRAQKLRSEFDLPKARGSRLRPKKT